MTLRWEADIEAASWIVERVHGFARDVGSIVPNAFAAYARIFHPVEKGPHRRWCDLAAANGRIAYAEMQYHLIRRPVGDRPDRYEPLSDMDVGSLPREELDILTPILARHTARADRCWFAVWEGFGQLHGTPAVAMLTASDSGRFEEPAHIEGVAPPDVLAGAKLELPGRAYFLLSGELAEVGELYDRLWRQSPNIWWPDDRAWCVATEIDFGCTYVGGTVDLIEDIVGSGDLEAMTASPSHRITSDGDLLNAALDSAP